MSQDDATWRMCRHLRQLFHTVEALVKANITHNRISCDDVHKAHSKPFSSDSLNLQYASLLQVGWEQNWQMRA